MIIMFSMVGSFAGACFGAAFMEAYYNRRAWNQVGEYDAKPK